VTERVPPFEPLTLDEFRDLVRQFPFDRRITAVHMHHTFRPNREQFRADPRRAMNGMWRFHTEERRFQDIAQHVTIAPDGLIWTGRHWNLPPASAADGSRTARPTTARSRPGRSCSRSRDFDHRRDPWDGVQRSVALEVAAIALARFGLPPDAALPQSDGAEVVPRHADRLPHDAERGRRAHSASARGRAPREPRGVFAEDATRSAREPRACCRGCAATCTSERAPATCTGRTKENTWRSSA
jgi:hypothetical protein